MSPRIIRRFIALVGAVLALSACHQNGTEFIVDVTSDSVDASPGDGVCADAFGNCSLRAAVMEANALSGVEEIKLTDGVTYELSIAGSGENAAATGDLDLTEGVVITGDGTIDANGLDRVLDARHTTGLVEIDGPNLTGGSAGMGAALHSIGAGNVSLVGSIVRDNSAGTGAPVQNDAGQMWVWNDTITDNTGNGAGGIGATGGVANIKNVTVDGNDGVGIVAAGGTVEIRFSTVIGNDGGGLTRFGGIMNVEGTIIGPPASGPGCTGIIFSLGYNIDAGSSCGTAGPGDVINTDPGLGPLADNGGGILTRFPEPTSPAVDHSTGACASFNKDALDQPRPAGAACDAGAIELQVGDDCATPGPFSDLRYCDLTGFSFFLDDIRGSDLTGADMSGVDARFSDMSNTDLFGTKLSGADMEGVDLDTAEGAGADFSGTVLMSAEMFAADFPGSDFSGADLSGADMFNNDLTNSDFTNGVLSNADIQSVDFTGSTFTGIASGGITGSLFDLPTGWFLINGHLVGPGANLTNASLPSAFLSNIDMTGANLTTANLSDATLTNTNLSGANLTGANLFDAGGADTIFSGADLSGASLASGFFHRPAFDGITVNFSTSLNTFMDGVTSGGIIGDTNNLASQYDLTGGYLIGPDADLSGASITGVSLQLHHFDRADLSGADLTGSSLRQAWLTDADLTGTTITGDLTLVISGGIIGTPASLPAPWQLNSGYLLGPRANLIGDDLSGLTITGADLNNAEIYNGLLVGTDFVDVVANSADLGPTDATGATFSGTNLAFADMVGGTFTNATFTNSDLHSATTSGDANFGATTWTNTVCPSGVNSDTNGNTCLGEL